MPLMCWLPEDNSLPYFEAMYLMQVYILFLTIPFVAGFDALFFTICLRLAMQVKIFCKALKTCVPENVNRNRAEEVFNENMEKIISHHQFLLR